MSSPKDPMRLSPMARWLTVLEAFLVRDDWGVRELAETSGLPKSAVHRILHEMTRLDVLAPGERPGTFRVGAAMNRSQWHAQADTGWVKNLGVRSGHRGAGVGRALLFESARRFYERGTLRMCSA